MLELAATFYVIERVIEWTIVGTVVVVPMVYFGVTYVTDQIRARRHRLRSRQDPAWVAEWEADIRRHEASPQ